MVGGAQDGAHDFDTEQITGVVGVDAVSDPEVFASMAVGGEHGVPEVDEMEPGLGMGGDIILDELIGGFPARGFVPTAGAGSETGKGDGHGGLDGADLGDKRFEVGQHLIGGFADMDVVAADVEHDEAGVIGQDEPGGIIDEVRSLKGIDAAVDDGVSGEVLIDGFPAVELGVADKENGVGGRRGGSVGGFVAADDLLEAVLRRVGLGLGCGVAGKDEREDKQLAEAMGFEFE